MNYSTEITSEQLSELNFDITFDADRAAIVTKFAAKVKGDKAQGARRYWAMAPQVRADLDSVTSDYKTDKAYSEAVSVLGPQISCLKFLGRIAHLATTGQHTATRDADIVKVADGLKNLERFYSFDKSPGAPSLTMMFMALEADSATGMVDIARAGAVVRLYGHFGDTQYAARIARGEILHDGDPLKGDDGDDDGDDDGEPDGDDVKADPAETFRLAIAQATQALGKDAVRLIFMESQG